MRVQGKVSGKNVEKEPGEATPGKLLRELTGFDVLTDLLGALGLRSRLFCRTELGSPWVMVFPPGNLMHFHIIERGHLWLHVTGEPVRTLGPGDLIVIGRDREHRITDQPGQRLAVNVPVPPATASGRCTLIRQGGKEPVSVMTCGSFGFELAGDHPLLAMLPPVIHVRANNSARGRWADPLLRLLSDEALSEKPGAEAVISRLTDVIFVRVLRSWLAEQFSEPNILHALSDPRVGPALALIHERPGNAWSVEKLAARVGLSRSPFTSRFTRIVGEAPRSYITRVRLQHAARLIRENNANIGKVALAVGYATEAAFSKAFKRQYGKAPGEFRKRTR